MNKNLLIWDSMCALGRASGAIGRRSANSAKVPNRIHVKIMWFKFQASAVCRNSDRHPPPPPPTSSLKWNLSLAFAIIHQRYKICIWPLFIITAKLYGLRESGKGLMWGGGAAGGGVWLVEEPPSNLPNGAKRIFSWIFSRIFFNRVGATQSLLCSIYRYWLSVGRLVGR